MLILLQRRRSSEGFGFDGVVQPVGSRNRRGRDMTIMARTRKTRKRDYIVHDDDERCHGPRGHVPR